MTKAFYFERYVTTALLLKKKKKVKKGTLPCMIYFTWIKCHKTCNVSLGYLNDNQLGSPKRKKNGPTKHSFHRVV